VRYWRPLAEEMYDTSRDLGLWFKIGLKAGLAVNPHWPQQPNTATLKGGTIVTVAALR